MDQLAYLEYVHSNKINQISARGPEQIPVKRMTEDEARGSQDPVTRKVHGQLSESSMSNQTQLEQNDKADSGEMDGREAVVDRVGALIGESMIIHGPQASLEQMWAKKRAEILQKIGMGASDAPITSDRNALDVHGACHSGGTLEAHTRKHRRQPPWTQRRQPP